MSKILFNNSKRTYQHNITTEYGNVKFYTIGPKEKKEVPDNIAEIWLKSKEIELFKDNKELEEKDAEIARLKAQLNGGFNLKELREEAKSKGIKKAHLMGVDKLREVLGK